jgi:hypothetical protein
LTNFVIGDTSALGITSFLELVLTFMVLVGVAHGEMGISSS